MALVTIQRSPSPSLDQPDHQQDQTDSSDDFTDGKSQMRKRSRTSKEKLRKIFSSVRFISKLRPCLSQSYFTVKGAALILPHTEFTKKSAQKSHGGEIQNHLQAMLHLLRPEDTIKIAVRLEDINQYQRYMALVSTRGHQDMEEAVILGIDCSNTEASIGLVLPIWMGLKIKLGGDGGFSMSTDEQCYLFKPVSVQAMWSAIQSFVKVQHIADDMKFIPDGLSHTWVGYYRSRVDRKDAARGGQWFVEGVEVFAPSSLSIKSQDADEMIKLGISQTLKEVMMTVDLDEATSIMLRKAVEEKMNMSLTEFKGYFDEEVMRILGQMDEPSEILDFLYLGSEWNASNIEELLDKGIDYILNVTKEIDNFFEGRFHYYSVRVHDEEKADLLRHWDKTYKFISKARSQNSKVLVHCKMGVSRSASTVMAFIMKDRRWSVDEAFNFVKERRNCVHPNSGFMDQLYMYEAILTASNKRDIFRSKSDQNLLDDEGMKDEAETSPSSFLGDNLFHTMSHSDWLSACGGVACEEEWIGSLQKDQEPEFDDLKMDTDLDIESRSADSLQEDFADLPSPEATRASGLIVPGLDTSTISVLVAPLTSSHSNTTPTEGVLPPDIMAHEPETSLEVHSDIAMSLLEDTGCSQLRASQAVQSSRLKADSSWIRLDSLGTELEETDGEVSKLPVSESVPSLALSDNTEFSVCGLDTTANGMCMWQPSTDNNNQGPQFVPAETTVPESLPYLSTPFVDTSSGSSLVHKTETQAQLYIGNLQNLLNTESAVPSIVVGSSDVITAPSGSLSPSFSTSERASSNLETASSDDQTISDFQSVTGRPESPVERSWPTVFNLPDSASVKDCEDTSLENPEMATDTEKADTSDASNIKPRDAPVTVTPVIVAHHPSLEHISLELAQVREMLAATDQSPDQGLEKDGGLMAGITGMDFFHNTKEEGQLLDQICLHQPTATLSSSHSCMELCCPQGDGDAGGISLFERENIPLVPGRVLRTRLEIEERQRFVSRDGDQEMNRSTSPVLRTSSLKQPRDTSRSRYTQNRRLSGSMLSPFSGKSWDHLQPVGMNSKFATNEVWPQSLHAGQQGATPVARPLFGQTSFQTTENASEWDIKDKQPNPELSGSWSQDVDNGKFDPHTLALIREIGSALSMSPNHPQPDETDGGGFGTNMVKYFVRKIEKQTKNVRPACKNVVMNSNTCKFSTLDTEKASTCKFSTLDTEKASTCKSSTLDTEKASTCKFSTLDTEKASKPSLADVTVYSSVAPSSSQCSPLTPTKPRQIAQSTSQVFIELSTQPDGHQGFCSTAEIGNTSNPDNDLSRTSLDVPVDSHKMFQTPNSLLESKHNIRPTVLQVTKDADAAEIRPACSISQSPVFDSQELSVVKHLVEKSELRSPDHERVSSESDYEYIPRLNDGVSLPACEIDRHDNNLHQWFLEDSYSQISTSTSCQADVRLINSPLTPPLLSCSLNPMTISSESAPLTSSQHVVFHTELTSTQTALNPNSVMGSSSTGINPLEPSEEISRMKDTLSAAASSCLALSSSSLDSLHKPGRSSGQAQHSDVTQSRKVTDGDLAELEDVLMRQVSSVGRKIRRLHGKTHPLTKLSSRQLGRSPFYSSM